MKLFISFSGGKSSALMAHQIKTQYSYKFEETVCIFANTGQEHENTLEFVRECDIEFNLNVVWVEAVVDPRPRKGTRHRVVDFETAHRGTEIFEAVIAKYGISNKYWPHCSRELKERPMYSYLESLGWKYGDYLVAIGIRNDERKRTTKEFTLEERKGLKPIKNYKRVTHKTDGMGRQLWYPLVENYVEKQDVHEFWSRQRFNLSLPEHYGNCLTCWKKSDRKLQTVNMENPQMFDFFRRMEKLHADSGAGNESRVFFRQKRSVDELLDCDSFTPYVDENQPTIGRVCE